MTSFEHSVSGGKRVEREWRGESGPKPPMGELSLDASIPVPPGLLTKDGLGVKNKIDPLQADLSARVRSVSDVAESTFDREMAEMEIQTMLQTLSNGRDIFQNKVVDTNASREGEDDFPELHPKHRPEPKWDGTLLDMKQRIQALHKVILIESERFNQTQDQDEKAEIGKFLAYLFEDMDTWIHRFEVWKAAYEIPKAIQERDQNQKKPA